jgi:hypothetical protein
MKRATGLLYIVTGIAVLSAYVVFGGAMLGFTTPIFSLQNTLVSALCSIGPSMLILVGTMTALTTSRKILLCLLTALAVVILLSLWTVPRIGWNYASRLFLMPEIISLVISIVLVAWIKRRWISAAYASALSAPFFVCGSVYLIFGAIFGSSRPALSAIWIFVPACLGILAFVSAVRFRIG